MSNVNPVSPDDVIVGVRLVMSEVKPVSYDDVIVEVRQVKEVKLSYTMTS
jgi:hypothetical protein